VEWIHTALAMGSWFLLWVDCGPRTQEHAAGLIAQVVARTRQLPLFPSGLLLDSRVVDLTMS